MEGVEPHAPVKPSLEQLKALDSLPNLQAQLKTADALCNHAHRAEMILRWLTGKLQKDKAARVDPGSWTLFTKCLRLVTPQKLGGLLSRFDLLTAIRETVANVEIKNLLPILEVNVLLLSTISQISEGPQGASAKRLVCAEGAHAAAFFSAWFARIVELWKYAQKDIDQSMNVSAQVHLLEPAINVWHSRKAGRSDHATFAENCLAPCSLLLRRIDISQSSSGSTKRKRTSSDTASEDDIKHSLELLLAKHVILPTRSAFFQTESSTGHDEAAAQVATVFLPLSQSIARGTSIKEVSDCLPQLLDIALRSVSTSTPRQRTKERPWVEAVFHALLDCLKDHISTPRSLVQMLSVIGARSSLKTETLRILASKHAGIISRDSEEKDDDEDKNEVEAGKVDFDLVANIVRLDPSVFIDDAMARSLFQCLTAEAGELSLRPHGIHEIHKGPLNESILTPVMKAFASARKLEAFVKHWRREIQAVKVGGLWMELDEQFADLLELQYNAEQIETLLEQYSTEIKAAKDVKASKSRVFEGPVRADFVISNAILQGVRSDAVRGHLAKPLRRLFDEVLEMRIVQEFSDKKTRTKASSWILEKQAWQFLSRAFRLWFPLWAARQSDASVVEAEAHRLLSASIVECARAHARAGHQDGEHAVPVDLDEVGAAEQFIGLLCHLLGGYEGCWHIAAAHVRRLSLESQNKISSAFVAHPNLLDLLDEDDSRKMVRATVEHLAFPEPDTASPPEVWSSVCVVVQYAASTSKTSLLHDVIVELLRPLGSNEVSKRYAMMTMDVLSQVPTSVLSREQRETIVSSLAEVKRGPSIDESQLKARLALIVRLMEGRNLTTDLTQDPLALWRFCPAPKAGNSQKKLFKQGGSTRLPDSYGPVTLTLLAELVRVTVASLLSAGEPGESQKTLKDMFGSTVQEFIDAGMSVKPPRAVRMTISTKIIQEMNCVPQGTNLLNVARTQADDLARSMNIVLKEVKNLVQQDGCGESHTEDQPTLRAMLEAILVFKTSPYFEKASEIRSSKVADVARKVIDLAFAQAPEGSGSTSTSNTYSSAAVMAYKLLQATAKESNDTVGQKLLQVALSPEDRQVLIDMLRRQAKEDSISGNHLGLLDTSTIVLLRSSISDLTKDSLNTDEQAARSLLPRLLETLESPEFAADRAATSCIITIFRNKTFLVNQHATELTLATLKSLARTSAAESRIYIDLCAILTAVFTHHRAKLQGRFHLVITVLQALQSRLFKPNKPSNAAERARKPLTTRHARAYTRLLALFCNPSVHKRKAATELVDESRRARAHAGQYVQYLLHSFCASVLSGTLSEGVREGLTPGLWAIIEAMEVHSPESIKVLSASMNNSERAVLRGVYDDWKRFAKWEGT